MNEQQLLDTMAQAVIELDAKRVEQLTREALDAGVAPFRIIADGLSQGIRVIGERFKCAEVFIPEVLVACDAYYAGLNLVKPLIEQGGMPQSLGKIVIGTIYGDIHTVGKDVAVPVFQAAGFDVIDLGTGVPDQQIVEAVREHQPQIVGLGTYMTSTFMHTRETVRALADAGLRDQVKVICGGPAVDQTMARKMGADDATDNAWDAVERMKKLVAELGAA
jgi:corrinoid protein of di/trimethylamine methyltransferase